MLQLANFFSQHGIFITSLPEISFLFTIQYYYDFKSPYSQCTVPYIGRKNMIVLYIVRCWYYYDQVVHVDQVRTDILGRVPLKIRTGKTFFFLLIFFKQIIFALTIITYLNLLIYSCAFHSIVLKTTSEIFKRAVAYIIVWDCLYFSSIVVFRLHRLDEFWLATISSTIIP